MFPETEIIFLVHFSALVMNLVVVPGQLSGKWDLLLCCYVPRMNELDTAIIMYSSYVMCRSIYLCVDGMKHCFVIKWPSLCVCYVCIYMYKKVVLLLDAYE